MLTHPHFVHFHRRVLLGFHKMIGTGNVRPQKNGSYHSPLQICAQKIRWNLWHLMGNKRFIFTRNDRRRMAEIFIEKLINHQGSRCSSFNSTCQLTSCISKLHQSYLQRERERAMLSKFHLSIWRAAHGLLPSSELITAQFLLDQLYFSSSPIIFPHRESFTRAAGGQLTASCLAPDWPAPPPPIVWKRDHLGRDSSAMHTANSYDKPKTAASHAFLDHQKTLLRLHLKGGAGNWLFDPRSVHEVASARR